jgi:hypothetical protein
VFPLIGRHPVCHAVSLPYRGSPTPEEGARGPGPGEGRRYFWPMAGARSSAHDYP